ncbi:MAG: carbohydrate kinase family protein [Anaerolineales bacterium]|nr:carbohydrate kinase family protein [Anaerolineales bacterium]
MSTGPVVVLGDLNIDALLAIPAYPAPGGDALATRSGVQPGGSAANTALLLARLGQPSRLLACAGRDAWAEPALRALAQAGVDTQAVQSHPSAPTGLFFIPVTPDGERTMFGLRGANAQLDPSGVEPALAGAAWLHLSGYALLEAPQREAALRALALARARGLPISVDVGRFPALQQPELVRGLLPGLAMVILDLPAARALVGPASGPAEAAEALVRAGVGLAALTLGAQGAYLRAGAQTASQPAYPVDVVDTTGAGDAFSAGLILAQRRGLSLPAAGALAAALGALAASVWGAGPALPGCAEVRAFLAGRPEAAEILAALAAP